MNYSVSGGTATTTPNYTSGNGTINFAANQTVGTISVPILAANPQGGNKTFVITLSSPSADSGGSATLGTQTTATATIVDSTPLTNNLFSTLPTPSDIEESGPFANTFFPRSGARLPNPPARFSFIAFEIMEFSKGEQSIPLSIRGSTIASLQEHVD